jgi:hypothetical protein
MRASGEIKAGMRVRFLDGGPDLVDGIVNGEPWVYFDGTDAVARVPVFVPATNRCVDVHGGNILAIGESVADLRPAFSGRV